MPRVTYVKAAQQRYQMVPVTGEDGQPVRTEVAGRTAKSGRQVSRRQTRPDLDKPLPPYTCDYCHEPIAIGTPYKHISPKSGPYGSRKLTRHGGCPTWQPWDYSNSLSARLSKIAHDFDSAVDDASDPGAVESAQSEAADAARELAEEKRESAQSIEEGFQHPTSQSEELNDTADQLDEWANEIEGISVPDFPEPEETDCESCDGEPGTKDCEDCAGEGTYTPEEPADEQVDEWREEVRSEFSVVSEPPA